MTVTDNVNAITGNSFSSTLVSAAITTAEIIVSGYVNETYTAGDSNQLDSAVSLVAVNILEKGKKDQANLVSNNPPENQKEILSQEVRAILDSYMEQDTAWVIDNTMSDTDYVA